VFHEFQRFFPGQYADVFAVGSYDPDFGRSYFVVDSRFYGFIKTFFLFECQIMVMFAAKIVNFCSSKSVNRYFYKKMPGACLRKSGTLLEEEPWQAP